MYVCIFFSILAEIFISGVTGRWLGRGLVQCDYLHFGNFILCMLVISLCSVIFAQIKYLSMYLESLYRNIKVLYKNYVSIQSTERYPRLCSVFIHVGVPPNVADRYFR